MVKIGEKKLEKTGAPNVSKPMIDIRTNIALRCINETPL